MIEKKAYRVLLFVSIIGTQYSELQAQVYHAPKPTIVPITSESLPGLLTVNASEVNQISISPNGKWLVVREKLTQRSGLPSLRQLAFYHLTQQTIYRFKDDNVTRLDFHEQGWTANSDFFRIKIRPSTLLDFTSGKPALIEKPLARIPLVSGGDPAQWRNRKGLISPYKPFESGAIFEPDYAWSPDGTIRYEIKVVGTQNCLYAQRKTSSRRLVCHDLNVVRAKIKQDWQKIFVLNRGNRPVSKEKKLILENMIKAQMPVKMIPGYFTISPDGHYLYYQLKPSRGPGNFALSASYVIHAVVDLQKSPAQVWQIMEEVMYTPRWHPDSKRLFLITNDQDANEVKHRPPMSKPSIWRVKFARFP